MAVLRAVHSAYGNKKERARAASAKSRAAKKDDCDACKVASQPSECADVAQACAAVECVAEAEPKATVRVVAQAAPVAPRPL